MSKKGLKLGVVLAAGAGAAAILTKTSQENKEIKATKAKKAEAARSDYRNTERGKYAKVFIIQTVTTKHSPVRKSQKASMTKTLIS